MSKVSKIKQKIAKLQNDIFDIQDSCLHENIVYEARSDTGNYSPSDDRYWYVFNCLDCEKIWTERQSYGVLSKYPNVKKKEQW